MLFTCRGKGLFNQYAAGVAASLSVVTSASTYAWATPLIGRLLGPDSDIPMTEREMSWVVSLIALGSLLSPLPAGLLSNYFGRKILLLATAPLHIVPWLLVLYFPSVEMLMAARVIQGLAVGVCFAVAPVYLGEISDKTNRGAITCLFFNSWWLGLLVAYCSGPYLSYHLFTCFVLGLNIPFIFLFFWQPDTPHYFMMVNNEDRALQSLAWFRGTSTEDKLREELKEIKTSLEEKKNSSPVKLIFNSKINRHSLYLLLVLTVVRTSSGAAALSVYATQMFHATPNLFIPSDMITIILGVVFLAGGLLGLFLSDRLGRRPLFLISCVGALICQLFAGTYYLLLFQTSINVSKFSWVAPCLILLYGFFSTAGLNSVCSSYISELFTSHTRSVASGTVSIASGIFSFIMIFIFEPVIKSFGLFANFYINALSLFLGLVYFYLVAPETKGKSFSEILNELEKKNQR